MKNTRDTNLDLLRILSMMMIITLHSCNHGGLVNGTLVPGTFNWYLGELIFAGCHVAVNCFVLLSGYFQCTSQFKLKRVVSLWVQVSFYSVVLYTVAAVYCGDLSVIELVKRVFVVITEQYWFVTAYLLMYIVSPFLNCMIAAMNKRSHFLCCCVLLVIFCVAHNLAYVYDFGDVDGGYTFLWFCILYIVAAYIRLHVPAETKHRSRGLLVYGCCALGVGVARFVAHYATTWLFGAPMLTSFFHSYNSILVVPASIGLFMAMRAVKVEGNAAKAIGFFAPLAFGVYLIHDHPSIRPMLWSILKPHAFAGSAWMVPYVLVCVIGILLVCCAVEWVRQWVFRVLGISGALDKLSDRMQAWVSKEPLNKSRPYGRFFGFVEKIGIMLIIRL